MELVSVLSFEEGEQNSCQLCGGGGEARGRQLVSGAVVLSLLVISTGLFLPLCVCPKLQL